MMMWNCPGNRSENIFLFVCCCCCDNVMNDFEWFWVRFVVVVVVEVKEGERKETLKSRSITLWDPSICCCCCCCCDNDAMNEGMNEWFWMRSEWVRVVSGGCGWWCVWQRATIILVSCCWVFIIESGLCACVYRYYDVFIDVTRQDGWFVQNLDKILSLISMNPLLLFIFVCCWVSSSSSSSSSSSHHLLSASSWVVFDWIGIVCVCI